MGSSVSRHNREIFYKEFKSINPTLIIGLIIISLGFYIISWFYVRNKEILLLDEHAPDPVRGTIVMFMLPLIWVMVSFLVVDVIGWDNILTLALNVVMWVIIAVLILKYWYDFCLAFGVVTNTKGIYWFFLCLIPFMAVPAMQWELNSHFERMSIRRKNVHFYR